MPDFPVTVHYEDTDLSGFVYHANYLKFIERGRSDWVRGLGIDQNRLRAEGLVFAVHRIEADFLAPARLDDRLTVQTQIAGRTPARMVLAQQVVRSGAILFRARVTLVCMTVQGRPRRLPEGLAAAGRGGRRETPLYGPGRVEAGFTPPPAGPVAQSPPARHPPGLRGGVVAPALVAGGAGHDDHALGADHGQMPGPMLDPQNGQSVGLAQSAAVATVLMHRRLHQWCQGGAEDRAVDSPRSSS